MPEPTSPLRLISSKHELRWKAYSAVSGDGSSAPAVGQRVLFELRYPVSELYQQAAGEYLRKKRTGGALAAFSTDWGLHSEDLLFSQKHCEATSQNSDSAPTEYLVTTRWLLSWLLQASRSQDRWIERKERATKRLQSLVELAVSTLSECFHFLVPCDNRGAFVQQTWSVDGAAMLHRPGCRPEPLLSFLLSASWASFGRNQLIMVSLALAGLLEAWATTSSVQGFGSQDLMRRLESSKTFRRLDSVTKQVMSSEAVKQNMVHSATEYLKTHRQDDAVKGVSAAACSAMMETHVKCYTLAGRQVLSLASHVHIALDESKFNGESTLVGVVHSSSSNISMYAPLQVGNKISKNLDEDRRILTDDVALLYDQGQCPFRPGARLPLHS
mmetsp:Transcript_88775/g.194550  ORF Transcript_88775/g.194550 Transcript_88775/m.194550 type:complete len:385 (+) Transcript_88775:159-1313(+)